MAKQKEKPYDYVICGFGTTAKEAKDDAISNLPYSIKPNDLQEQSKYARLSIGNPEEIAKGQYKVEIRYDLLGYTSVCEASQNERRETRQNRRRSSSYASTDPFRVTRHLNDHL